MIAVFQIFIAKLYRRVAQLLRLSLLVFVFVFVRIGGPRKDQGAVDRP